MDNLDQNLRNPNCQFVCILLVGCLCLALGCNIELSPGKGLPAPINDKFPYEIGGVVNRLWGADHFEVNDRGTTHFLILEHVIAPKRGQPFFKEARIEALRLLRSSRIRCTIQARDDFQREIGNAYVGKTDVSLALLEAGLVWVNFESDGALSGLQKKYLAAQEKARRDGVGLWSEPDPVHPSNFGSQD